MKTGAITLSFVISAPGTTERRSGRMLVTRGSETAMVDAALTALGSAGLLRPGDYFIITDGAEFTAKGNMKAGRPALPEGIALGS